MKKIVFCFSLIMCLTLTSCDTYAQIPFETYVTYSWNGFQVTYTDRVPYYSYCEHGVWYKRPVPPEHRHMIHRHEPPQHRPPMAYCQDRMPRQPKPDKRMRPVPQQRHPNGRGHESRGHFGGQRR